MAAKKVRHKQAIPKDESNADRFKRVATPRVAKALKAIGQIKFLAASTYESTAAQQRQILTVLSEAVVGVKSAFEKKSDKTDGFAFTE